MGPPRGHHTRSDDPSGTDMTHKQQAIDRTKPLAAKPGRYQPRRVCTTSGAALARVGVVAGSLLVAGIAADGGVYRAGAAELVSQSASESCARPVMLSFS